jgi:hypothetical protein
MDAFYMQAIYKKKYQNAMSLT